jgi:hypothetical protein
MLEKNAVATVTDSIQEVRLKCSPPHPVDVDDVQLSKVKFLAAIRLNAWQSFLAS